MKLKKGFNITLLLLLLGGMGEGVLKAQTIDDYSTIPPFIAPTVQPNVLLLVDNSGSMNNCAYPNTSPAADHCQASSGAGLSDQYLATESYFGYFESDKCYSYAASKFSPTSTKPCANAWDGNFLNWATMRRLDITKWVMTGGQCNAVRSSENSCSTLRGQTSFNAGACCHIFYKQFNLTGLAPSTYTTTRCIRVKGGEFVVLGNGVACSATATGDDYFIRVDAGVKQTGVIQEVGSRARFGLMVFDDDGTNENGGEIRSDIGGNVVTLVNAIEGMVATSWTPLAESLYEAARYYAQIPPTPDSGVANFTVNVNNDPHCFGNLNPPAGETGCRNATQGRWVPCCQNFVIVFTDGQPTRDASIPAGIQDYAHAAASHAPVGFVGHCDSPGGCTQTHGSAPHSGHGGGLTDHNTQTDHHDNCSKYYGGVNGDSCGAGGSHFLDDVAFWAHTTDLRPETGNIAGINEVPNTNGLPGVQSLTVYSFFAFGGGSELLKDAAKVGGFKDKNNDGLPDLNEWDENGDGVPDTYFESRNAFTLRSSLVAAITKILQESASGTSVSVLATSSGGEGAIYQAYFYPRVGVGADEVYWQGFLQGLFFDFKGQLREDTNQDGRLILSQDKIVETYFDEKLAETWVNRYDVDASGNKTGTVTKIPLSQLLPVWEAGKKLADRDLSANPRVIKTWVDGANGNPTNGQVEATEFIDFSTANVTTLRPYLRAATPLEGTDIIEYIRGNPVTGYRPREVGSGASKKTWRLGDIIYSSPVSVGAPQEGFDTKYKDSSYTSFYEKYKNRRHMVYVGANDGMLHAFNGGFFHPGDDKGAGSPDEEHGWFTTGPSGNGLGEKPLGEELWGFIPQELLPHLKWLTQTDYNKTRHVYYVDGSPRITDAQIFDEGACATSLSDPACVYPKGWGTILIGSMRMGGGLINVDLNGDGDTLDPGEDRFRSAYFALDITNPEAAPKLLWVFKDADLGFTTSWPAIMRFDKDTWHVVFGSGPLTYKGERDRALSTNKFASTVPSTPSEYGQIYSINLKTGALVTKLATDNTDRYAFMGDPVVYDLPKSYATDIVYIGKNYGATGAWRGKVHRLLTYGSADPTNWRLSVLFDPQKPVLSKVTATLDGAGRFWVYFGTGRFFSSGPNSDQDDVSGQAFYGIKDSSANGCWDRGIRTAPTLPVKPFWKSACPTVVATDLLDVTSASVSTTGACSGCGGATTLQGLIDLIDSATAEKAGWVLNLTGGERVLHESTVLGGIVAATSYKPGADICFPQGTNAVYALHYGSGAAYPSADINDADGDKNYTEIVGTIGIESDGTTVRRKKTLGVGTASKVNLVAGYDPTTKRTTLTGFVQSSTGEIVQIRDIQTASGIDQGTKMFREKSD